MKPVTLENTVLLESPRERVWPLITDTDRLNRVLGVGPVAFRPADTKTQSAARFIGMTRAAGFAIEYEELPFEWIENESFRVERRMRKGPLRVYRFSVALAPREPAGTRATIRLELEPRSILLAPIARLEGFRLTQHIGELARSIDAFVRGQAESPYAKPRAGVDAERLAAAVAALTAKLGPSSLAARVGQFIQTAADADVVRMRPFELARTWQEEPDGVLRAMLHGVSTGLLDLRWSLVCPSCRTATTEVESLADVGEHAHCQLCDVNFDTDLDRSVEATFIPHPSVRKTETSFFCIGGPARTPHVVSQCNIDPGGRGELRAPMTPGRYRLFARGGASLALEVEAHAAESLEARLQNGALTPARAILRPGARLAVDNAEAHALHVKIERLEYAMLAATAHAVSQIPEFRRAFSKDLLKPKTPLKVSRVAIMFTDLTGSTALYTNAGDAAAFRFVDDHFDVLRPIIEKHEGVIVKTMGDAIMASFAYSERATEAALEAIRAFDAFRAASSYGVQTGLKLGMYSGPCYVVTANDRLDYFGQTVNVASRLQHLAESSEIIVEEEQFRTLPEHVQRRAVVRERLQTRVKGVEVPIDIVRLVIATDASRT